MSYECTRNGDSRGGVHARSVSFLVGERSRTQEKEKKPAQNTPRAGRLPLCFICPAVQRMNE